MNCIKCIRNITIIAAAASIISVIVCCNGTGGIWFTLAITSITTLYHVTMRLLVGWSVNRLVKDHLDYKNFWFREKKFEKNLYGILKVKQWKDRMPTHFPEDFSLEKHSVDEIIQTMCVSEIVHELIVVLGYVSLLFAFVTGDWKSDIWIFLITALIAGGFDSMFVIMQRYNRPRLVRLKKVIERNLEKNK